MELSSFFLSQKKALARALRINMNLLAGRPNNDRCLRSVDARFGHRLRGLENNIRRDRRELVAISVLLFRIHGAIRWNLVDLVEDCGQQILPVPRVARIPV